MNFKSVYSSKTSTANAVQDIKEQLQDFETELILFFASSNYAPQIVSLEMSKAFEGVNTLGCTTSGELTTGKVLDNSIVAMAFGKEVFTDYKIEVIENLSGDIEAEVKNTFASFEEHFEIPVSAMNYKEYVGMVLIDGLSLKEELLMDAIGDHTNVIFVGGSAGDDLKFKETHVCANGKAYTNASVLVLMQPKVEFSLLKTQSFKNAGKTLKVTKANEEKRQIIEFNNKPAAKAYAEALEVEEQKLADKMFLNPIGLMAGNEPYVRSPRIIDGENVFFYCSMKEGMELQLLNSTDIIDDTKKAIQDKEKELGSISAIINFHCILRTLELKEKQLTDQYGQLFKDVETIGFSTYGECYLGHINQTSTMLIFK